MTVITTEVDADFFPGNTGSFNNIFSFPVRPGCSQLEFFVTNNGDRNCAGRYQMQAGTPTSFLVSNFNFAATTTDHRVFTTTSSGPLTLWYSCEVDLGGNTGFVGMIHLKVLQTWSGGLSTNCQYGTQPSSTAQFVYYLTPGLIDVALSTEGLAWLAPLFTAYWFSTLNVNDLCGSQPPAMPPITLNSLTTFSPQQIQDALYAVLWPFFCQCSPAPSGGTPPTPFPTPAPSQPINWPAPISFACDGQDLCTLVNQLMQSVASMQQAIVNDYKETTLIQRQAVPFGYVPGFLHIGLTDAGTIDVQGILGLSIESTTTPPTLSSNLAPVASYFKLGEISMGTADGFAPRRIVTHNPHLFLDIDGDITQVAYLFMPGVVANILELIREP